MAQSSADYAMSSGSIPGMPSSMLSGGGIDNLLSQMQGQSDSDKAELRSKTEKYEAQMQGPIGKLDKLSAETDKLKVPELTKLPEAPQPVHSDPLQTFGSPASWLAVFGGLMTKNHLTNSLNAASGVMNARNQGDAEATKYQMDLWKANTDNALKMMQFQQDQFKDVMDKIREGREGAIGEAGVIAEAMNNPLMSMLAKSGDSVNLLKTYAAMQKQTDALAKSRDQANEIQTLDDDWNANNPQKPDETPAAYKQRQDLAHQNNTKTVMSSAKGTGQATGGTASISPESIAQKADAIAKGASYTDVGLSMRPGNNPDRDAVDEYLAKNYPDFDRAQAIAEQAGRKSEQHSIGIQTAKINLASNMLDQSLPSMMQAAEKVGLTPSTDLNKVYNAAKQRFSDQDFANFSTQLRAVTSDYAQFIGRGRLTVHSDEEALRILNDDMGISSLQGFVDAVNTERGNVAKAIDITKGGSSGTPKATHKYNSATGQLEEVK